MPRLLFLLLIGLALWYGWQYLQTKPPEERKRQLWVLGVSATLLFTLLLAAMGRMHWLGVAFAALIPLGKSLANLAVRFAPIAKLLSGGLSPSVIKTKGLKVSFNFTSGEANGDIFSGPYAGQPLQQLNKRQLEEQLLFFKQQDKQSAMLMQAYLLKRGLFGVGGADNSHNSVTESRLSEEEALQVLGLETGASKDEVIKAHKRLIQKLHPDRGGNQYLAAKVNGARDTLVG